VFRCVSHTKIMAQRGREAFDLVRERQRNDPHAAARGPV
jgi:hypothetical protein